MSWLSLITFFFEEALVNLRRHKLVTVATVSTVAITIGVWVLFSLEAKAWERLILWEGKKLDRVCVFFKPEVDEKTAREVAQQVKSLPQVSQVKFVHKDEGLRKLQEMFGNSVPLEDLVGHNPLPHALEVTCISPRDAAQCAEKLRGLPVVDEVTFPAIAVKRYVKMVQSIRWRNHALSLTLAVIALILIFNALRLSVYGRRNEIRIMQLVGATVWTARGPLLVEGLLYGILGAVVTLLLTKLLLTLNAAFPQKATYWTGLGNSWSEWRALLQGVRLDGELISQVLLMGIGLSFSSAVIAAVRLVRSV